MPNIASRFVSGVKSILGYRSGYAGNPYLFIPLTGSRIVTSTTSITAQASVYSYCPPVASIVNRKTMAALNAKFWILDENGKEIKTPEADYARQIMSRPNPLQSWRQFLMQVKTYEQLFGEVFIFTPIPVGFKKASTMWAIPNWLVEVEAGNDFIYSTKRNQIISKYIMTLNDKRVEIPPEAMFHHKDVSINTIDLLRGQSRLVALQDPVTNIIAAYEARNVMITRKGAIGILSNETKDAVGTIPMKPDEKTDLQKDFKKYGITKDKFQIIITNANLKWQSMTFPTKDLMLFEEIEDDIRQICDNYGYPMHLLGFKNGTTFTNMAEAKLSLYQDTIIPEMELFTEGLSDFLGLEKQPYSLQVYFDHLEIFQKSAKELADSKKAINEAYSIAYHNGVVTLEEWRIALDYDPKKFTGKTFYQQPKPEPTPEPEKTENNGNQEV